MTENRRRQAFLVAVLGTVGLAAATMPIASGNAGRAATGEPLALRATLAMRSVPGACTPELEASICATRDGSGTAPGLGRVTEAYMYPIAQDLPGCSMGTFAILPYTVRLTVAGKGELMFAVPGSNEKCLGSALNPSYSAGAILGGSGLYAGVSGTVTLQQHARYGDNGGAAGTDTWVGTLTVPGLTFDVTPPRLSGAVGRTVRAAKRAKSARVAYKVTATDNVDGAVATACKPRSGSRLKIGRTRVRCAATDSSANTGTATFRIVVKAKR